jgi:hypothetical protein
MKNCYPGMTPLAAKEQERPPWRTDSAPDWTARVDAEELIGQAILPHALSASPPFVRAGASTLRTSDRRTVILEQLG